MTRVTRRLRKVLDRTRLFQCLDEKLELPAVWLYGIAGSGKTTLVASYLERRPSRCVWHQLDSRDHDPAEFFHRLTTAAGAISRRKKHLPRWPREPDQTPDAFCRHYFKM